MEGIGPACLMIFYLNHQTSIRNVKLFLKNIYLQKVIKMGSLSLQLSPLISSVGSSIKVIVFISTVLNKMRFEYCDDLIIFSELTFLGRR